MERFLEDPTTGTQYLSPITVTTGYRYNTGVRCVIYTVQ
jgi:hypothetical protein